MGMLNVWPSYAIPMMTAENSTILSAPMSKTEESLIGSLPSLGAMLGTALVGPLIETFGRKMGGVALALPFVVSYCSYTYIPLTLYPRRGSRGIRYSSDMPTFYHNYSAMSNTADITGGRPIAV
jgi:MFS family permease